VSELTGSRTILSISFHPITPVFTVDNTTPGRISYKREDGIGADINNRAVSGKIEKVFVRK
jgi:hypothetical protein